tara:strand:- start:51 stop:179 length:129 start_codon:yes stop_codon:yes gene_type:complete
MQLQHMVHSLGKAYRSAQRRLLNMQNVNVSDEEIEAIIEDTK